MPNLSVPHTLSTGESLRRLADVEFGRLLYTRHALLTLYPVNHLVDGGVIVVHAHPAVLTITSDRQAVAYQADTIDHETHAGWCVTVHGMADDIDPDRRVRYQHLLGNFGSEIRLLLIEPDIITGIEYRRQPTALCG
ncbi:pyridoxamine 5'-phosphate oxidase family protein [Nocardia mexicana]|uniref:Pyridoxamine 5'-phosphate oxidase-like protein n=1 Tax=Nocardia mexicana TaxID=279262 RepID=A0A370HDA5_9NOCA|nr:pyridoxamine 5'-phosphate oxidase family protein [Nocardia mexicana]RDI54481.1 pyridoxamine 5'-phosphate oxidase-like protein [Nocardia mexicana]